MDSDDSAREISLNGTDDGWIHYNPIGTVHGGVAATLLDSCMSCAVQTTIAAGLGYTTLEIKVNYVRPMKRETGARASDRQGRSSRR